MGHLLGSISQDAHRSEPSGMAFNMRGSTGTGKTEALYVIDNLSRYFEGRFPEFYRHTFEWVGLDQIEYLKPLAKSSPGGIFPNQMKRSPLVLLHPVHRKALHEKNAEFILAKTGFMPRDRIARDPQTEEIIRAIMKHYMTLNKLKTLTAEQYLQFLAPHVKIVRRIVNLETPAQVIEHQEVDPRPEQLFISPNPLRSVIYAGTALAYDYTGLVLQQDGGVLVLNEFYRNHPGLRSKFIELMQNRRVDEGGAPLLNSM